VSVALERTAALAERALERLRQVPQQQRWADDVARILDRLHEPLRVAIVGRVKAGKSTLLNCLVGERLAATDAGECTQIVSWYRHGSHYSVAAVFHDGSRLDLAFSRVNGRLQFSPPAHVALERIARFEIEWPAAALREMTLIDTPGLASLRDENSARTRDFLALGDDRPAQADMVVYMMRHMHSRDAEYLDALSDQSQSTTSAASAIALLSRADEIGGGRLDAMASAHRIASRYEADTRVRAMCARVLPVTALLGETGTTLSEMEISDLRELAALPPDLLDIMLLAADELCSTTLQISLPVEVRRQLLHRFGLFGLRLLVDRLSQNEALTAATLAPALVDMSGVPKLVRELRETFLPRTGTLKARVGLLELRRVAAEMHTSDPRFAEWLDAESERVENSAGEFSDLRLAQLVARAREQLRPHDFDELLSLSAAGPLHRRLGLPSSATAAQCRASALALGDRWRSRRSVALLEGPLLEVADLAVRVADRLAATAAQHLEN